MRLIAFVLVSLTGIAVSAETPHDSENTIQTPATAVQSTEGLRFSAISLRPNRTNPGPMSFDTLPNGTYKIVNESVHRLIELAYPGARIDRKSEPDWLWNERYDLTATSPLAGNATSEQRQGMMRALLEERFNFKAHLESHQEPAYDLVLARADRQLGPGLQPSPIDCTALPQLSYAEALSQAQAAVARLRELPADAPVPDCTSRTRGNVQEGDMTMSDLAFSLNFSLGASRSIVNKTGLAGSYRVRLVTNRGKQPGTATDTNDAPDIFTALEDQLGLKLEESERTVYSVIVDRVERPTAN